MHLGRRLSELESPIQGNTKVVILGIRGGCAHVG